VTKIAPCSTRTITSQRIQDINDATTLLQSLTQTKDLLLNSEQNIIVKSGLDIVLQHSDMGRKWWEEKLGLIGRPVSPSSSPPRGGSKHQGGPEYNRAHDINKGRLGQGQFNKRSDSSTGRGSQACSDKQGHHGSCENKSTLEGREKALTARHPHTEIPSQRERPAPSGRSVRDKTQPRLESSIEHYKTTQSGREKENGKAIQVAEVAQPDRSTQIHKTTRPGLYTQVLKLPDHHRPTDKLSADYRNNSRTTSISSPPELEAYDNYTMEISNLITNDAYFRVLTRKAFGKTVTERSTHVFWVFFALLKTFGARLKDEATSAKQMASADIVIAYSDQVALAIQTIDGMRTSERTLDDNLEARVFAFLLQHTHHNEVPDSVNSEVLPQLPRDGFGKLGRGNVPVTNRVPLQELKWFLTSSRALMELRVSLRRLIYPSVLDAINADMSRCVPEAGNSKTPHLKYKCQTVLDLEWDLYGFLQDQIEGEMDVAKKVQMLWSVITVTGDSDRAWATTCKEYMTWQWRHTAQAVMSAVQNAMTIMSNDVRERRPDSNFLVWAGNLHGTTNLEAGTSR
jgi:hypothetical protein